MSGWKSCPEAVIEHVGRNQGDALKVTWSDDITLCIEATYRGATPSGANEDVAISVDIAALPHLILALQHCMEVARLEGCYDEATN